MKKATVPVLHAELHEGRTYYVRLVFGEWDAKGPVEQWGFSGRARIPMRRCTAVTESTTSAMVALSPALVEWQEVPQWMAELQLIVPDRAAGQAWLDGNRASLESHLLVGETRFVGLRPLARMLATIGPADGAPQ
jgi:hypothetical protein